LGVGWSIPPIAALMRFSMSAKLCGHGGAVGLSVVAILLTTTAAGAIVPAPNGTEFQVNTTTAGTNRDPAVAPLPNGGYVVVWDDYFEGNSGKGIFGQRLDSNGNKVGSEFQVTGLADNRDPSVAVASTGAFVVAWESQKSPVHGSTPHRAYNIYAQRYDDNGNPVGGAFLVNTDTTDDQSSPSVAIAPGGGFIIAWQSNGEDGSGYGIFAQRYDSSGNPVGSEFQVNTYTTGDQARPAVATDNGGNFTIVWESNGQDGSGFGIYGQRYDSSGNKVGTEFRVNTSTANDQVRPAIAVGPQNQFVIVWQSDDAHGDGAGIFGQLYVNGSPSGSEFQVNTSTAGGQSKPTVAMDSIGGFLVAYESFLQNGNLKDVYAQRFDPVGDKVGAEFQVNSYIINYQDEPAVAAGSDGQFLVAWESNAQDGSGSNYDIFAQRLSQLLLSVPTPTPTSADVMVQARLDFRHTANGFCEVCQYCDCVPSCAWCGDADPAISCGDLPEEGTFPANNGQAGFRSFSPPATQQTWGFSAPQASFQDRIQAGVGVDPFPLSPIKLGEQFPLTQMTAMNWPIIGDFPTSLRLSGSLHVEPPGEPAFDLPVCDIPLNYLASPPAIEAEFTMSQRNFQFVDGNGTTWNLSVLGWRDPSPPNGITTTLLVEPSTELTAPLLAVLTRTSPTPSPTPTGTPTPTRTQTPLPTLTPVPTPTPTSGREGIGQSCQHSGQCSSNCCEQLLFLFPATCQQPLLLNLGCLP
jgi:hypothetical protein